MFLVKNVVDKRTCRKNDKQQFLIGKEVTIKETVTIGKPIIFEHSTFKESKYVTKEVTEILEALDYIRIGTGTNYYYLEKLPIKINWKRELKV